MVGLHLQEGKTFEDMKVLYAKEVEVAKKCGGCLHFQLEMNETTAAAGTAVLHESYTGWQGHLELNKALDEAGLVAGPDGIFATYKFNHFAFSLPASEYSEEYKGLMAQFEGATGHAPVMHLHDFPGKVRKVRVPGDDDHVSLHLTFGLQVLLPYPMFTPNPTAKICFSSFWHESLLDQHSEPSRLACSLAGWQDAR